MTLTSTTVRSTHTGDGTTVTFSYGFKIFSETEVAVYVAGVLKTITTDYSVSGVGSSSGGNITFETSAKPASSESIVFVRVPARTQTTDYTITGTIDPQTVEDALDKTTMLIQDIGDSSDTAFGFANTVTDAGTTKISSNASDRGTKLLGFDSSGNLVADQEIGTFQGNWAASTAYVVRDIIKDTNNNNIYICNTAHTSSGAVPISTNTDVAKWDLLVDAASASTSATAAASSASAAATSATAAASSATSSASSATSSASSATSSASSATSSASSATSSASSSTTAGEYANKVDGAVTGTEFSSKAWALGGTGVTDTASRGAAKEWATAAEDDLVDGSEYSAKHYSLKAQAHATNAAANSGPYYSATTGTDTYVATPTPVLTSYAEGVDIILKFGTGNTGATTLNVNGLGAKDLTKADGSAFSSGELTSGQIQHFVYNGTEFRLMGTVASVEDLIKINTLDIFQNTINDMADHSDNLLETVDGFTDNFQDGSTQNNTAFDLTGSSNVTHDNTNKLWGNTDGSTNQNSDKDYTTESNYIQQEWDETIVGANATFTNGSATVTTTGTFPTNATAGRISQDGTNWYAISSRDSATQITLASNFAQSTVTGTFTIRMSQFTSGVVKLSDNNSFFLGDGRDGSVTITTGKNINTDVIGSSRSTNADGIVTTVSSNPTGTSISVASITGFADGDKLLLMNLQGGSGDVADVGNYEILTVDGTPTGTTINVVETISKSYDGSSFGSQKVICQRIPQWSTVAVNAGGSITCSAFDGSKGGVVICYATGSITLASGTSIHADAKGYRGSLDYQPSTYGQGFSYVGEGRTGQRTLRQAAANDCGGGAGNNHSTSGWSGGGGGGGHSSDVGSHGGSPGGGATSGYRGDEWGDASLSPRIGFGGGGGQGGKYNAYPGATLGGAGGGIVYLMCDTLTTTAGGLVQANGGDTYYSSVAGTWGGSGGGAGGTVWVSALTINAGATDINANKGAGTGGAFSGQTGADGGSGGAGFVRLEYTTINSQSFENDTEENLVCYPDPTGGTGSSATTPLSVSVNNSEYVSVADSYAQSTDISAWLDINSSTITETLNSQNAYYWVIFSAVSGYGANTEVSIFNQTGSVWRTIAKNSAGTWQYNNNASHDATQTLVNSTVNDMLHAVSQAISTQAANRMTGTEAAAISDAEWAATNGFATSDTLLTRGLTLYSASSSQNPEVSQFRVNYDSDKLDGTFLTRAFGGTNMPPVPSSNINTMVALIIDKRTTGTPTYEASSNGGTTWTEFSTWVHEDLMSNGYTKRMAEIDVSAHTGARTSPLIRIKNGSSGEDYDLKAIGIKYK